MVSGLRRVILYLLSKAQLHTHNPIMTRLTDVFWTSMGDLANLRRLESLSDGIF